jgi:ribonuclease E
VPITVQASDRMQGGNFAIERSAAPLAPQRLPERSAVNMDWGFDADGAEEEERPAAVGSAEEEGEGSRRSRRRRRRGRRDGRDEARVAFEQPEAGGDGHFAAEAENGAPQEPAWEDLEAADATPEPPGSGEQPSIPDESRAGEEAREERRARRGRRRGRRGGRRGRDRDAPRIQGEEQQANDSLGNGVGHDLVEPPASEPEAPAVEPALDAGPDREEDAAPTAAPPPRTAAEAEHGPQSPAEAEATPPKEWTAERPHWRSEAQPARDNGSSEAGAAPTRPEPDALPFAPAAQTDGAAAAEEEDSARPIRRGWWQRRFTST